MPHGIQHNTDGKIIYTGPSPRGWHRLQAAAECLQKYAWDYEAPKPVLSEKQEKKGPALVKGSLVHLACAQHYATMRAEQRAERGEEDDPNLWCDPYTAVDLIARMEGAEQHTQGILDTYEEYTKRYPYEQEFQSMQIIAVEDLVETRIQGYWLTGRLDLAYRDMASRIWVVDHKTSTRITKNHKIYYGMSGQMQAYLYMARETYSEVAGMKINMIQHATASNPPKFERFDLMRSAFLESKFEQSIVDIEQSIEQMKATGRGYDDWPKAMSELTCFHRYGPCKFLDKCRHGQQAKTGGMWEWSDNFMETNS